MARVGTNQGTRGSPVGQGMVRGTTAPKDRTPVGVCMWLVVWVRGVGVGGVFGISGGGVGV